VLAENVYVILPRPFKLLLERAQKLKGDNLKVVWA
jgi:hypothetical protein